MKGENSRDFALLAGLASGLVFWITQEATLAVLVSGSLWFFYARRFEGLRKFGLGFLLLFATGWVAISGYSGVRPFVECALIGISQLVSAERLSLPTFRPDVWQQALHHEIPWVVAWESLSDFLSGWVPLVSYVFALTAAWLLKKGSLHRRHEIAAIALFGLLMLLPAWGRSDRWHIFISISPLFLLWGLVADWESESRTHRTPWIFLILGTLSALLTVPHALARTQKDRAAKLLSRRTTVSRAGAAQLPYPQANAYEFMVEWISGHTRPEEPVLYYPYNGAFYFLADRPNPSRFPILAYAVRPSQQADVVRELDDAHFKWVIFDQENTAFDGKPIAEFLGPIDVYLRTHFISQEKHGPLDFRKRMRSP